MITLLKSAIVAFAKEMSSRSFERSAQTNILLLSMKELGRRAGYIVDYPGDGKNTEWLYDQTWLSFEETGRKRLLGVEMALECEWEPDRHEIMKDFNKLLQSRAKIKVFICHDPYGGLVQSLKEAISQYPGVEPCTYLLAVCDFENAATQVVFAVCDEKGMSIGQESGIQSLLRSLRALKGDERNQVIKLNFEGFWPNKKTGFPNEKTGFYFVFAGVRKRAEAGYVAVLNRVIFIGTTVEVVNMAQGQANVFERHCLPGEIPYFAFAEIPYDGLAWEEYRMALIYRFHPSVNALREDSRKPMRTLAFSMDGDVATCLGDRTFVVQGEK